MDIQLHPVPAGHPSSDTLGMRAANPMIFCDHQDDMKFTLTLMILNTVNGRSFASQHIQI